MFSSARDTKSALLPAFTFVQHMHGNRPGAILKPSSTHIQQARSMNKWCLRHGLWLLVWACCLQACRPVPQKVPRPGTDECLVQALDFEYLKISASIGYQDYAHRYSSAYVNFRIKKDNLIWFSVLVPWGIEILRGVITPAGITLLNHMQHTYYVHDYATLRALYPGPWDYALIQALLLGELARISPTHEVIKRNYQHIVVQQQRDAWTLTHLIDPSLQKVEKLIATAIQGSLVASYEQFKARQEGGLLFRRATLDWYCHTDPTQPAMTVTLKNMKVQWPKKPLHFPCSIPEKYEKKQTILDF
jgi:Domain of unknown function (DUF4292)